MKYIVVTGGVVSGLGKGITISSIGRILKASGLRVTAIKIDPYLNVDAGTMSPFEHGETFVLNDGGETDLDLGNYERFLDIQLTGMHNITSGKIYSKVISQERRGDYLGKTVQIVPHATNLVQKWIKEVAQISVDGTGEVPDVCLVEVGGTVGDIESMVFLEALRQFQFDVGTDNIMFMHVSLVPVLGSVGEQKTKPTQHSVKELRAVGLSPDVIICRSTQMLEPDTQRKISAFCHVAADHVIAVHDVSNLYHVPLVLVKQGLHGIIRQTLKLEEVMHAEPDLTSWTALATAVDGLAESVSIAVVGKYVGLSDSYLSVIKALKHSGIELGVDVHIHWVEAADLEDATRAEDQAKFDAAWATLRAAKGVLVPGGFGTRGVEGKVAAARYAREGRVPYLGVCLGMQVMVIEYARSVLGLAAANSAEFDAACAHPVVVYMPEISKTGDMGGTMRLGARNSLLQRHLPARAGAEGAAFTMAAQIYGFASEAEAAAGDSDVSVVEERHRHRYEVNPAQVTALEANGALVFSGKDDTGERMETVELRGDLHPFYFGAQFHPEFKSRPGRPSPPFFAFVAVSAGHGAELGRAGRLWREYEEGVRREVVTLSQQSPEKRRRGSSVAAGAEEGSSKIAKVDASVSPRNRSGSASSANGGLTSPSHATTTATSAMKPADLVLPKPLNFDI